MSDLEKMIKQYKIKNKLDILKKYHDIIFQRMETVERMVEVAKCEIALYNMYKGGLSELNSILKLIDEEISRLEEK